MKEFSFAATGDSFITRPLRRDAGYFRDVAAVLGRAEVRFTNLETVVRTNEGFPAAQSGGTWASSPPHVLHDLRAWGFNLAAWANNHTLDYSYGGLAATARHLEEAGFVHAGVGNSLAEADAPRYLETPTGRVALIAATSTFHESWMAGAVRPGGPGRPGVNPLRFQTVHRIPAEHLAGLKAVAALTGINAAREDLVRGGFAMADGADVQRVGQHLFSPGGDGGEWTSPHEGDLRRILARIEEAARQADVVLVSIHAHEGKPAGKELPADFLVAFARACIDGGAHAVIGHGPHVIRGIEIYRDRPIFYSLGNFIFQNEGVRWLPADFYEKYGVDPVLDVAEALAVRSGHGTRGLALQPKVWRSVIASWRMAEGRLVALNLTPLALVNDRFSPDAGIPQIASDAAVLEEMAGLSETFGTKFRFERGVFYLDTKKRP